MVGFALWVKDGVAWAAGTYEYRAMGAAVISQTDLFRHADFHRDVLPPRATDPSFVGLFASMGHVNDYLLRSRARGPRYPEGKKSTGAT